MGIFSWIILGLLAGVIAKIIMPGKQGGGFVLTTLLGIGGALIGGFVASLLNFGGISRFDWRALGLAVVGALILLALFGRKR
jgi:uncharacterized membrane protein YeaQ/YmgE (transglycosylase-associated protein family)